MSSTTERSVLTAPGALARAAARVATLPEQRWILCQPRDVYIAEVLLAAEG